MSVSNSAWHDCNPPDIQLCPDRSAFLAAYGHVIFELLQDDDNELRSRLASANADEACENLHFALLIDAPSRKALACAFYFDASLRERVAEHLHESVRRRFGLPGKLVVEPGPEFSATAGACAVSALPGRSKLGRPAGQRRQGVLVRVFARMNLPSMDVLFGTAGRRRLDRRLSRVDCSAAVLPACGTRPVSVRSRVAGPAVALSRRSFVHPPDLSVSSSASVLGAVPGGVFGPPRPGRLARPP